MEFKDVFGAFYLHTNGDVIWKPQAVFYNTNIEEYFDSPFVQDYQIIPWQSPTGEAEKDLMWTMDWMRRFYEFSNNKDRTEKRIREICKLQQFPEKIADTIIKGKKQ